MPVWIFCLQKIVVFVLTRFFFRLEIRGRQYLDCPEGPVILAGNHTGWMDSVFLAATYRKPIRFLVAEHIFQWPVIGWLLKQSGMISITRGNTGDYRAIRDCVQHLVNECMPLCIFPEGELTKDGELGDFQPGIALIAKLAQAKLQGQPAYILPFVIHGGYQAWPYGRSYPLPARVILEFGKPMVYQHTTETREQLMQRLRDWVFEKIVSLRGPERAVAISTVLATDEIAASALQTSSQ